MRALGENHVRKLEPGRREHIPEERRRMIAQLLQERGSITVATVEECFGVSPMTARRDLVLLAQEGRARRTHGGAMLPELAAHEDSFDHRLELYRDAKARIGATAAGFLKPGETVFVDSSTTAYRAIEAALARRLPLTILTNSLPVMTLIGAVGPHVQLVGLGGSFRVLTRSFVGSDTVRAIEGYFADRLLFAVKGVSEDGHLTDADPLEADVKRAMIGRARSVVFLATEEKFSATALSSVARVDQLDIAVLCDPPPSAARLFDAHGVRVQRV